jgi:hypothetical protein
MVLNVVFQNEWFRLLRSVLTRRMEIKCELDETEEFFIADLIACSTRFGLHYAHLQELESILQVVAVCRIWCLVFKLSI